MLEYLYVFLVSLIFLIIPCTTAYARPEQSHAVSTIHSDINEQVYSIPFREGGYVRVLFCIPTTHRGTIIMFPGGSGDIGLGKNGVIRHDHNFVVRTRRLWNRQGYAVIIPDTINHINLRGKRSSATYAGLIQSIIAFAHEEATVPVFLFGTSQGAIAAVNGAAHAASGTIAGVVLSESVSVMGGSKETVFTACRQLSPECGT